MALNPRLIQRRTGKAGVVALAALIALSLMAQADSPFGPSSVLAATITVDTSADANPPADNGLCSLREAIVNAEADALTHDDCEAGTGEDTIVFSAAVSTIMLAVGLPDIEDADGLTINGGGDVTIDGQGANPFEVNFTGDLTLIDIMLTDAGGFSGGAIDNEGTVTLDGVSVTASSASVNGGGIYNSGTMTIRNSLVSGNDTLGDGGGIFNDGGHLEISETIISDNESASSGGGIATRGTRNPSTLIVERSAIVGNSAVAGGGLYNYGDTVEISNSTISGNIAGEGGGGGIFNNQESGRVELTNVTIAFNQSSPVSPNSGIHNEGVAESVLLLNTIVAENTPVDCTGSVTSLGNNLDSDGTCLDAATDGDIPGGSADLGSLGMNGGSTPTHALSLGSDAIDAASNDDCEAEPVDGIDQRGVARPHDGDGNGASICDIGAYEAPGQELEATPTAKPPSRPNIGAGLSGLFAGQPTPLPTAPSAVAPAVSPTIRPPSTGDAGLK